MLNRRIFITSAAGTAIPALLSAQALAQQPLGPAPIRLIAGSPPGGSTDAVARLLSDGLGKALAQPVVVINQGGAGGNLATDSVARAAADGHTLLVGGNFSHGINPVLYKDSRYDPIKDFSPITRIADFPSVIAVTPQSGITSLRDLIAKAKANPGKLTYASGGNGTPAHLAAEYFKKLAGVQILHVPYRGGGPSAMAALAGEVDVLVGTPPVITPHLPTGKLKAICVTYPERYAILPDIPSSAEAGLPELSMQHWFGLWGPAGVPTAAKEKLFAATHRLLSTPEAQEALARQGLVASASKTVAEFESFVAREVPIWKQRVLESGATAG